MGCSSTARVSEPAGWPTRRESLLQVKTVLSDCTRLNMSGGASGQIAQPSSPGQWQSSAKQSARKSPRVLYTMRMGGHMLQHVAANLPHLHKTVTTSN
eukprot:15432378-Alexandrium_andersonii.AAC.1